MTVRRAISILAFAVSLLGFAGTSAWSAGLVSGSYSLNWSKDVQLKIDKEETRTLKHTLETKYSGFLSAIVKNEITLKIEYEKGSKAPSELRFYPIVTLAYKGSYWNAGSKRSVTREPDTNQKVADTHFVEIYYLPPRLTLPDFKGKYTADFDVQSGTTDKFKQGISVSSSYQPQDWISIKGDYAWSRDEERFKKDPPDLTGTPVATDEKYNFTVGVRHFVSEKLKFNSEWKSEFGRSASFFDNGVAKVDSGKEDQTHTMKNTLAYLPFSGTSIDANYDYDLKQTMVPKIEAGQAAQQEHTLAYNTGVHLTQKVGESLDFKGEFTRSKTDIRHNALPGITVDDGWAIESNGKFSKQFVLGAKYSRHSILSDNPGAPNIIPKRTGSIARSLTWSGELLPVWKPSASYDRTDSYDHTITRGKFLKTIETKYSLKGPIDLKLIEATLDPTYDISLKSDYTNINPALSEKISIRDLKVRISKNLLRTRTTEAKAEHSYGRKIESGHIDHSLNNVTRSDSSTFNISVKDVVPDYAAGFDFTRSATDTSGDADKPDVTENFTFKIDYKRKIFAWNASYKYDRNLREDKTNKWTFDWKAIWTANVWDVSLTFNKTKTLSFLRDESYKVGVDFKYNF